MKYTVCRQYSSVDRSVSEFAWMTTMPTEPGWYWAKHGLGDFGSQPRMVQLLMYTWYPGLTELAVLVEHSTVHPSEFTHWLGPLPAP